MGEKLWTATVQKVIVKFFKGLGIIAGILLALLLASYVILDLYLDSYIKSKLEKEVSQVSKGLYQLDINYLHISLSDFSVISEDISFTTDSTKYQALLKEKGKFPVYYQLSAKKLYMCDLDIWPLLWGEGLHIPEVVLSRPDIYVISHSDGAQLKKKSHYC